MSDAMFLILTPQILQKIITGLDDLYEYMLGKLATAGINGQFRTPKQIRGMMVELLQPTPDDTICEIILQDLIQRVDKTKRCELAV